MKYSLIFSLLLFLASNHITGQYLKEQECAILTNFSSSGDMKGLSDFLETKGFLKDTKEHNKYIFYNWKKTDGFYYGVRINKSSKQVTYLTNDQNYVLRLLSHFMTDYSKIKSEKQGENKALHIFDSKESTIAVMLDTSADSGSHLLYVINK
ncbi:hypothetical protein [Aquimarina mytili]|uniref:Uncharacterized protein n=1 Tax=Aquimarina mytili TaxID=874423 RepID=A0A937A6W5_9FLAO|nr:hypothetical protein [Aquimarina mytili]MBL0685970.1 hypothetical protein [Aquimarina mytili]